MLEKIGFRATDLAVQRGVMFTPQEALTSGLVDKVVPPGDLLASAREEMEKLLQLPGNV